MLISCFIKSATSKTLPLTSTTTIASTALNRLAEEAEHKASTDKIYQANIWIISKTASLLHKIKKIKNKK
jgi:hypothetical protein